MLIIPVHADGRRKTEHVGATRERGRSREKKKKRGKGKRKETTQKEVKVRIGKAAWSGMHLQ